MARKILWLLPFYYILYNSGCSNQAAFQAQPVEQAISTSAPLLSSTAVFASALSPSFDPPNANPDSKDSADNALPVSKEIPKIVKNVQDSSVTVADSTDEGDEKVIAIRLESARQHYLSALQAQTIGDSLLSVDEFEQAIGILNEISYYPDIENSQEYNELSRSVVEDYEKYIASIDEVGPESSIFALREKLNLDIDKIDLSKIKIPNITIPFTTIPLQINDLVEKNILFFMDKGRDHFERWLFLSGKYFPTISRIFKEEGVPEEMMYLSMMESGLNPSARSWAKAVGLWQFMKGTGKLYGLRGNYWYDERRDFEKATRAAARFLKDLHEQYDDWHLAIAGYNSGGGRINRGIRKSRSNDFWTMRRYLPRETRNYVPQYIAVSLMSMNPEAYGFKGIARADSLVFEYVTIDDCVDLDVLAECAQTTAETLRELNPELIQWCTPPNYPGYRLRIPAGSSDVFLKKYAEIPDNQKRQWAEHKIRRGDTPGAIARKYGIATSVLLEVNKLNKRSKLRIGNYLVIPVSTRRLMAANARPQQEPRVQEPTPRPKKIVPRIQRRQTLVPAGRDKLAYVVKKGDTLGHIAEWFGVRASDLRNWNNIPYGRLLQVGATVNVWIPSERLAQYKNIAVMSFEQKNALKRLPAASKHPSVKVEEPVDERNHWVQHKVKKGETLDKIARDYAVAIADLKSWNKLHRSKIFAGQILEVYVAPSGNLSPESSAPRKQPQVKSALAKQKTITHKIKRGETLEKIAGLYNVSIADLKKWNRLSSSKVLVGKKMSIRLTSDNFEYYRVRTGDTLWEISKKFGVSVDELQRWNDLVEDIRAGDRIVIHR
jgi:membrane-bound lytic murein transglycosylase D